MHSEEARCLKTNQTSFSQFMQGRYMCQQWSSLFLNMQVSYGEGEPWHQLGGSNSVLIWSWLHRKRT